MTDVISLTLANTDSFPEFSEESGLKKWVALHSFKLASFFTEPIVKAHESYWKVSTIDSLYESASKVERMARKAFLYLEAFFFALLSTLTFLPSLCCRYLAVSLQEKPFIHLEGNKEPKELENKKFSLLSWNICMVGGGYPITDGGVTPWRERIDAVIQKIQENEQDVLCLYETFDTASAFILAEKLKSLGYVDFYFNMGAKVVGVSSGMFVASKYKIQDPEFIPFSKDILVGRTKNASKGIFSFFLASEGKPFAKVFSTHLQHSEEPSHPTKESREDISEIDARKAQMDILLEKALLKTNLPVILTGDLNMNDDELKGFSELSSSFEKNCSYGALKTWGGDEFCAKLTGKEISYAQNLDHTFVRKGFIREFETTLVETEFDSQVFQKKALSDHLGLNSSFSIE